MAQTPNSGYGAAPTHGSFEATVSEPTPVSQDWVHDNVVAQFARSVVRDWKRNNCWPEPFVCPDRGFARAPYVTMVNNGWRRQNLLSGFHFEADTGKLNPAGEEKLRWILNEVPEQHRSVYVSRGMSAQETANRMASVEKAAAQIAPDGPIAPIIETNLSPGGWPADRVDVINRKFQESTPEPRVPKSAPAGADSK